MCGGGGEGGVAEEGEAPPCSPTPYPFLMPFLTAKEILSYTFYCQKVPLSHTLFRTLHSF